MLERGDSTVGGCKSAQACRERAGGNAKKNVNITPEVWHSAGLLDTAKDLLRRCGRPVTMMCSLCSCFSTN